MSVRYEVALWNAVDHELGRQADQPGAAARTPGGGSLRRPSAGAGAERDIGITVGAASKLVDRLERDGLAYAEPEPRQPRSSLIALTAAGQQALASASAGVPRRRRPGRSATRTSSR